MNKCFDCGLEDKETEEDWPTCPSCEQPVCSECITEHHCPKTKKRLSKKKILRLKLDPTQGAGLMATSIVMDGYTMVEMERKGCNVKITFVRNDQQ